MSRVPELQRRAGSAPGDAPERTLDERDADAALSTAVRAPVPVPVRQSDDQRGGT